MSRVQVQSAVAEALRAGRAVVALESAVTTCGLPRRPLDRLLTNPPPGWDPHGAVNLQAALAMERTVRDAGAVPATIAVLDGVLRIGLTDAELRRLASDETAGKAAARDLAHGMTTRSTAGTTVSATLAACGLPPRMDLPPIRVMATGGIGGVHRGWTTRPDISSDLTQLAATPVCVVCSGVKSQLDAAATMEALETLGIPMIGFGTDHLPRFYATGADSSSSIPLPARLDEPAQVASLCRHHWHDLDSRSGVLTTQPAPATSTLPLDELEPAIHRAESRADRAGIHGPARTPYVLAALAELTDGRTLEANISLLVGNAALAGRIAAALVAT